MAYYWKSRTIMPYERNLLMPFSVRHFLEDDKLCHHMNLEVLQDIYPQEVVEQVLTDCRAWEKREKALNMVVIVYLVIAMCLFPRLRLSGVLRRLASGARFLWSDPGEPVPTDGAICQRRQQLGVTAVRHLFRRGCPPLATQSTKGAFRFGRRVVAMDGTCEDVADDPHNANYFGRINSGPTQSPFPQLRALYLEECGTHAIFDAVPAPCRVAEARLAPVLLRSITAEMLVLLDRGLFAGPLIEGLRDKQAHVVVGLESHVLTHPCTRLCDGSYLAYLSPQSSQGLHQPLLLRVITYQIHASSLPCHGQIRRLATTLLDPKQAPAKQLIALYHERWEIELCIDEHKSHLRLAQQPLRSRRPQTVLQEFYGLLLLHYGVRFLMHQAATQADMDTDRLSFCQSIELVQHAVYEFAIVALVERPALMERLLADLRTCPLPPRRLRFNARVVKRPLSRFRRKRHWHLDGPHLKGSSFQELLI
jgi:Insertion element 4 transposase N-terminal/Transposase DDE domain